MTTSKILISLGAAFIGVAIVFVCMQANPARASAPSGLPATVATSSNPSVGTTALLVFATSTCAARIVTTYANPIMITFTDRIGQRPTAQFGHLQAASTTVAYDSGQYGCDAVYIYGYTATTAITVSESR